MTSKKLLAPALLSTLTLAACSSSAKPASSTGTSSVPPTTGKVNTNKGNVDVLYAGSLVDFMTNRVGSSFVSATGYHIQGYSAGSDALASDIKGKIQKGDVFISASPTVNASLEGAANGDWVSWYITFATAPLVIGYNTKSRFAHDLQTTPWYDVVTDPGFRLGRTDPATDPKGVLAVDAINAAATHNPAIKKLATETSNEFAEETLVGELQAGQLDAGFFYTIEALAAGIPTVNIPGPTLSASYTVTILKNAPDEAGAEAFVNWLLGPTGRAALLTGGFHLVAPPTVSGSGIPASIQTAIAG